jgi:hypothetical protein
MESFDTQFNRKVPESKYPKTIKTTGLEFPHADAALELYAQKYEDDPKRLEIIREIFYTFFEQELNHAQIYQSQKFGVAFPFTKINVAELANVLYKKRVPTTEIPAETQNQMRSGKTEFIFGSFLTTDNGNEFTFTEEAMHQMMKLLPQAIEDLKNGKQPEQSEIFTLGSPTNTVGTMSPEFMKEVEQDTFGTFGKLYAEFIENQLNDKAPNQKSKIIEFFGISMGAGIAAKTGEDLLETGKVVQDHTTTQANDTPYLQIRAEVPVALGSSKLKKLQIPVGFIADSTVLLATRPYVRKVALGEKKFMDKVNKILEVKGIRPNMSDEQKKLKWKGLSSVIFGLGKGLTLKPETKITKIIGLKDITMYTPAVNKMAKQHRNLYEGSLGQNLVPEENKNQRTFSADMSHTRPFFRENEFRRMRKAAMSLEEINK